MTTERGRSRFDSDHEALAWARQHVQHHADRYAEFERRCKERGDDEAAQRWRRIKNVLHRDLIGGEGCVITAFDERKPELLLALDEAAS